MFVRKKCALCLKNHTKFINALCGQSVEITNIEAGRSYSNYCAFKRLQSTQYAPFLAALCLIYGSIFVRNSLPLISFIKISYNRERNRIRYEGSNEIFRNNQSFVLLDPIIHGIFSMFHTECLTLLLGRKVPCWSIGLDSSAFSSPSS
jgi:hypothetical protein